MPGERVIEGSTPGTLGGTGRVTPRAALPLPGAQHVPEMPLSLSLSLPPRLSLMPCASCAVPPCRQMGLQSLPVAFGVDTAKWICVSTIDVTQLGVAAYLAWGLHEEIYAAVLLALILPQVGGWGRRRGGMRRSGGVGGRVGLG